MVDGYIVKMYELIKQVFFSFMGTFSDDNIINFVFGGHRFSLFSSPLLLHFLSNSEGSVSSRLSAPSLPPPCIHLASNSHLSFLSPLVPPTNRPTDQLIIIVSSENPIGQILPGRSQETELCGIHSCGQLTIKDGKMGGEL